ncbi:conserved Plasmodium protein, unknown function [Plasmodium gallinaceum]|uniref:Uncharacterized protein n=1 Tax=Plasmodium gallinaceum TaxID=5849 RepID=A0A1J1H072_PLAGA|nr:conserved Plasmodium protein, unknown function [Plasmodium gallinaceum]CRG98145.1 conserved Plasmodium protein, unknown function [Plasmodium gallinaceum]
MYVNLSRNIKRIWNVKNIYMKKENILVNKLLYSANFENSLNTESCAFNDNFCFLNQSFINFSFQKDNKIIYEMRRDRGGTVRKKLSREKKKTQKKQKKDSIDIHK